MVGWVCMCVCVRGLAVYFRACECEMWDFQRIYKVRTMNCRINFFRDTTSYSLAEIYRRFEKMYLLSLQDVTPQVGHGLDWAAGHIFCKGDDNLKASELNEFVHFHRYFKRFRNVICFLYCKLADSLAYLRLFPLFTVLYFSTCRLK